MDERSDVQRAMLASQWQLDVIERLSDEHEFWHRTLFTPAGLRALVRREFPAQP